jgi:D-alanine-D-alanine ligase
MPLMDAAQPLNVVVLQGGPSEERAISLLSGGAVTAALRGEGHRVLPLDPAEVKFERYDFTGVDVAFNALHGRYGEDGEVQGLLDDLGVPYTGSGAAASRLAFSKTASKGRFAASRVATPAWRCIRSGDVPSAWTEQAAAIGYPLVVKPDQQGSSLGVTIVNFPAQLPAALERCFSYGEAGLLERFIAGTEWTVPLIDDEPLPVIQIVPQESFYDYTAKYADDRTGYRFEFDVPADVVLDIEQLAQRACRSLGSEGIARVDIRLDEDMCPWVLEVNTSPGMTDHSLVPKAAARQGLSLGQLCTQECLRAIGAARTRRNVA